MSKIDIRIDIWYIYQLCLNGGVLNFLFYYTGFFSQIKQPNIISLAFLEYFISIKFTNIKEICENSPWILKQEQKKHAHPNGVGISWHYGVSLTGFFNFC